VKETFGLEVDAEALPRSRGGVEKQLWPRVEAVITGKIDELAPIVEAENEARKVERDRIHTTLTERLDAARGALDSAPDEVPADLPEGEAPPKTRAELEGSIEQLEAQLAELPEAKHVSKEDRFYEVARTQYMKVLDRLWREHLTAMRDLRDSVRLQGYAQKDPKHVYKKEGYDMFAGLQAAVNAEVSRDLARMVVPDVETLRRAATLEAERRQNNGLNVGANAAAAAARSGIRARAGAAAASGNGAPRARRALPKIGRNDACWCGSGKKYKQCHMRSDREGADGPASPSGAAAATPPAAATPAPSRASSGDAGAKAKKGISII
jgi:uncharacterized protein YecA (UPF0149 family)